MKIARKVAVVAAAAVMGLGLVGISGPSTNSDTTWGLVITPGK